MCKEESGRARVRRVFIEPLMQGGMRKGSQSADDHKAMLDRIATKLAYLSELQLRGLREFCIRAARGKARDVWPREQHIVNWAYRLHPPPYDWSDYVASIMRSAMGRRAREGGYHLELFDLACRWGPPPTKYDIDKLRAEASSNLGKVARVQREQARGVARDQDLQWLVWYQALGAQCLAIMDAGEVAA